MPPKAPTADSHAQSPAAPQERANPIDGFARLPEVSDDYVDGPQLVVAEEVIRIPWMNAATGRWEEKEVTAREAPGLMPTYEANEEAEADPCNIDSQWEESGRAKFFAYGWLNTNAKHSARDRSIGYAPVDPEVIKLRQFPVQNLPGVGPCYVFVDTYLCEIPHSVLNGRLQAKRDRLDAEEAERTRLQAAEDKDIYRRSDGMMKVTHTPEKTYVRSNPILEEQASLTRALDMTQVRTGSRPMGL